jgi:hypothetical protein
MQPLWFAVMLRGPDLKPVSRAALNRVEAQKKADSLAFLHLVGNDKQWVVPEARVIIVDASGYYIE